MVRWFVLVLAGGLLFLVLSSCSAVSKGLKPAPRLRDNDITAVLEELK